MNVEEYRIKPRGLLDRAAVEQLEADLRKIVAQGGRRITIDFEAVTRALAETADLLLEVVRRLTGPPEHAPLVRLIRLPRSLVVQFQLEEIPVDNRAVVFLPGGKTAHVVLKEKKDARTHFILCRECCQTLRVSGTGMFGCPHCGVHFYADGAGHATFYEALRNP